MVYGAGLSQASALTLAQQHNEANQVQRVTSFSEIAGTCRRLLFTEFAPNLEDEADGCMPEVPRYNTHAYREFKSKCLSIIVNTQIVSVVAMKCILIVHVPPFFHSLMCVWCNLEENFPIDFTQSAAMVEQAIQMALQPSHVYHRMKTVFLKYEEGKLKGQKVRDLKGLSLQKALEGRYAAKLPQFKVFQGLQVRAISKPVHSDLELPYKICCDLLSVCLCWTALYVHMLL